MRKLFFVMLSVGGLVLSMFLTQSSARAESGGACIPDGAKDYVALRTALAKLPIGGEVTKEAKAQLLCHPDAVLNPTVTITVSSEPRTSASARVSYGCPKWNPRSITENFRSYGVTWMTYTVKAYGCNRSPGVIYNTSQACSGNVTTPGRVSGYKYQGTVDPVDRFFTYGGRSNGGHHTQCKGFFDNTFVGIASFYPDNAVFLHGDGSSETKQYGD